MREILFRGFGINTKKWLEGDLVTYCDRTFIAESDDLNREGSIYCNLFEVQAESVGQFTGLLDKNGKKVFEGDLVTIYDVYNACTAKGVAEIRFSYEYVGGWVASSDGKDALNIGTRMNLIEVVGNVWEGGGMVEQS